MNKSLRNLLCIIATFTSITLLPGCSISNSNISTTKNTSSTQIDNNHKNIETTSEPKTTSNEKVLNKEISKSKSTKNQKEFYLNKLNSTESNLNTSLEKKFAGTTLEIRKAAEEQYITWDKHLNEIYSELKKHLSNETMNNLKKEQIKWISYRDKQSKKEADEFKGGTLMPVENLMSLGDLTKKRCYELVNKYMN